MENKSYSYALNTRALVTGGAGFLGSHLCDRLITEKHDVICLDNFFTGQKRNVSHLIGNPYFELVRHDVTFPYYLETKSGSSDRLKRNNNLLP